MVSTDALLNAASASRGMDEVEVEWFGDVDFSDPVVIEGLPGVGHVGKLAAEHLIEEYDSRHVCRVYSEHFPPQVKIDDTGIASLAAADFYAVPAGDRGLVILVGDYQATEGVGHYRLTEAFLDIAESVAVSEILALGGVPTGELVEETTVIGAVTDPAAQERFEEIGVEFRANEPAGGIVGTSGLLLGLGARRDLPAACLMGETSGYLVDPKSAKAVLEILQTLLGFDVDFTRLEDRAAEMEEFIRQYQEEEPGGPDTSASEEDLRYFG